MGETLHPRQRLARRRRLQLDRRRQDLERTSAWPTPGTSARARPPEGPGPRLRRGARPRLRPEPGARRLPLAATAARPGSKVLFVDENAGAGRPGIDPTNPRILYAGIWQARARLLEPRERRRRAAALEVDRRRRHLEGDHPQAGPARRASWARSASRSRAATRTRLGHRRGRGRRRLPLRRRRRDLDAVSDDRNLRQRAWYYTHIYADPKDADAVYVLNVSSAKSIDGGQDLHRDPHAARRQPRPLDRPATTRSG